VDKDLVQRFMGMDLDKLGQKQALEAMDSLANFIENGSTAKMEDTVSRYQGKENARIALEQGLKAAPLKFYGSDWLGRILGDQVATLPMLEEMMFRGQSKAALFNKLSGLRDLMNAKTYVQTKSNEITDRYAKEFYKRKANGKDFTDASNVAERGIIASVKRNISGTADQQQAEFNRKKSLIEKSIQELKVGTEKEQKLAKIYEEAYNKVLKDSKNVDEVINKSDKNNVEGVDFWVKEWASIYDKLSDVSKNIYNKILDKDINYTPDRYTSLFGRGEVEDLASEDSQFHGNNGTVYQKKTGVLEDIERSQDLPKNKDTKEISRYLDLSFDKVNANAMHDALMDIHTAAAIRQVDGFFKSNEFKKIVPKAEDRDILFNSKGNGRVQDFVRAIRGKQIVNDNEINNGIRRLNALSSIGTSTALGSVSNIIKQTVPVALNTLMNTQGKLDWNFFMGPKAEFLNKIGYGISVRGLESQTQIKSINRLVDLASKSKGSQALKYIEKANQFWLETFLKHPDVYIARASWLSYYEKSLLKQDIDPKTIDYSTHEVNEEAADYAQRMIDRQQNISDHDLNGKLLASKDPKVKFVSSILMPFASFRLNQFMRAKNDLSVLLSRDKSITPEDRKAAAWSMSGYTAEMAMFKFIATGVALGMGSLTNYIMGRDESDEDYQKRYNNLVRGQVTGTITDVISPLPPIDIAYAKGADKLLDLTQSLAGVGEEDKFKLMTSSKSDDMTKSWGTIGIGIKKAQNLYEIFNLANTGQFTDEYGRVKHISNNDKESLKYIGGISLASNLGLLPADANTVARNAISFAKKDASTKEKTEQDYEEEAQKSYEKEQKQNEKLNKISLLNDMLSKETNEEKINEITNEINYLKANKESKKRFEKQNKIEENRKKELLGGYDNEDDLKKYNPNLYQKNFGVNSDWYKEHKYEKMVNKELNDKLEKQKDIENKYYAPTKNKDGSKKRKTDTDYSSSRVRIRFH
jgi:hypothetical protein